MYRIVSVRDFLKQNKDLKYKWNGKALEIFKGKKKIGVLKTGKNDKGRLELF